MLPFHYLHGTHCEHAPTRLDVFNNLCVQLKTVRMRKPFVYMKQKINITVIIGMLLTEPKDHPCNKNCLYRTFIMNHAIKFTITIKFCQVICFNSIH